MSSKWFWIILGVIILLILLHKYYPTIKDKFFDVAQPNYTKDADGNVIQVSALDQPRLKKIADDIDSASRNWMGLFAEDLAPALALSDQELEYVAKYFKTTYGKSLYSVLSTSFMPSTKSDDVLMSKLDRLALK